MASDLYLDEILVRLARKLDPDLFEDCVAGILQSIYPTLVLVPGGRDSGRDGLLGFDREEADFLVCTTQQDPAANLRKSLRSHKQHLKSGSRVVFATSRTLDGEARDKLKEIASREGYQLVQSYDRKNLAHLLYRRPEWCGRLLDLTGEPQALSKLPKSDRPLGRGDRVGQDEDASWLAGATGDCLLLGQPGSGKTFLLYGLCRDHEFYFVVGEDIGPIADGIREKDPAALILDDAHTQRELLRSIVHFRSESERDFRIIATCWPAEKEQVLAALQEGAQLRELQRLTRDQIVEVINTNGIGGPPDFLHELVDQADGRPGLAVTLCRICLQGGARKVALGEALAQDTRRTIEPLGAEAYPLLAGLAIGGDSGMELAKTAEILGLRSSVALTLATGMAAGGVLYEVGEQRLAVRPRTLRHALVRDVFFRGALALPHEDVIAVAPNPAEVANTLSGARARGGRVPLDLIFKQIELGSSPQALSALAWVGPREARAALDRYPGNFKELTRPCLEYVPEEVIPRLLAEAMSDDRDLNQATDHALRIVSDWIISREPGTGEVVRTRQILHRLTLDWLGGDVETGVRALMIAMSPKFDAFGADPGSGGKITIRFGSITSDEARLVAKLWPSTLDYLARSRAWSWKTVQPTVEQWVHPKQLGSTMTAEVEEAIQAIGLMMLRDLVSVSDGLPGAQQWLRGMAKSIGESLDVEIDPDFLTIYPVERTFESGAYELQREAAKALARRWASQSIGDTADRVVRFAEEADRAQIRFPRYDRELWWELAQHVDDPLIWAKEVIARDGAANILQPFLHFASQRECEGWTETATDCFSTKYKLVAVDVVLETKESPRDLLEQAIEGITGFTQLAEMGAIQKRYSETALHALLRHEDRAVAGATAMGIWHSTPSRTVPEALLPDWRVAVINGVEEDHDLGTVFDSFDGLAMEWLHTRVGERSSRLHTRQGALRQAVDRITTADKKRLLGSLDGSEYVSQGLISALVDDDSLLLEVLLGNETLRHMHIEVFRCQPDAGWVSLALVALDAGYSPTELVQASCFAGYSWTGNLSDMWKEWSENFAKLEEHDNSRIREIGRIGTKLAEEKRQQEVMRERDRDVQGW